MGRILFNLNNLHCKIIRIIKVKENATFKIKFNSFCSTCSHTHQHLQFLMALVIWEGISQKCILMNYSNLLLPHSVREICNYQFCFLFCNYNSFFWHKIFLHKFILATRFMTLYMFEELLEIRHYHHFFQVIQDNFLIFLSIHCKITLFIDIYILLSSEKTSILC